MLLENVSKIEYDDDRRLLEDYAELDTVLPVDNVLALLPYHTAPTLRSFYRRHRPEFDSHQVLVRLPPSERVDQHATTVTVTKKLPPKLVYRLEDQQYVFISQQDCFLLGDITLEERLHFQELYHDCLFSITPSTTSTDSSSIVIDKSEKKSVSRNKRLKHKRVSTDDYSEQQELSVSLKTTAGTKERALKKFRRDNETQELELPSNLCDMLMEWREEHDAVVERNHALELQVLGHEKDKALMEANHRLAMQEAELKHHRQMQQVLMQCLGGVSSTNVTSSDKTSLTLSIPKAGPLALTTRDGARRTTGITLVSEWIGRNLYGQEKYVRDDRPVPSAFQKWDCMFDNPQINTQFLHSQLQVTLEQGYRFRLVVPLTYAYNLRRVLQVLRSEAELRHRSSDMWDTLINACPSEYRVVLHALHPYDKSKADAANEKNIVVMATHLHIIMQASRLDRAESQGKDVWRTTLDSPSHGSRYVPDLSIIEEHYPSSLHFGTGTLLTFDMSIRVKYVIGGGSSSSGGSGTNTKNDKKKKKIKKALPPSTTNEKKKETSDTGDNKKRQKEKKSGIGTGNGKNCAFCKSLALLTKKEAKQVSHHPRKCHVLACLSNNEVDILNKLMQACRRGQPSAAVLSKLKFYFGIDEKQKEKNLMHLSSATLLRHATEEELCAGQHVNGLRINRPVLLELREKVVAKMRAHLDNDLFGLVDLSVQHFIEAMDGMQEMVARNHGRVPLVRQLIMDSDGNSFIASKFDEQKKSRRNFSADGGDDGLFFELDEAVASQRVTKRIKEQTEFFERERDKQAQFITNYVEKSGYLPPSTEPTLTGIPSLVTMNDMNTVPYIPILPMPSPADFSSFGSPVLNSFGTIPSFMFGDVNGFMSMEPVLGDAEPLRD